MTMSSRSGIEARDERAFVERLLARHLGYVPEWHPGTSGPDIAVLEILGHYLAAIADRLEQVPDKLQLVLLHQLGIELVPARPARAPVVFSLSDTAGDARVPAGTRLAAKAPEPSASQAGGDMEATGPATSPPGPILFEVERSAGLASAKLVELRSVWPGRDQAIDHMPALASGQLVRPWRLSDLEDMPHHLYLAHRTLLALSGTSHVAVTFELSQGCTEHLALTWEYWDGKVWRPFRNTIADCDRAAAATEDSTAGLQQSGTVHLVTDCAETKVTAVGGVESFWVRGRLTEPLVPNPAQLLPEVEQLEVSTILTCDVDASPAEEGEPPAIVGGIVPDSAIVDDSVADLSKPFYPFGQQPQPGSVFYFASEEVFSKPGATVEVCFVRTQTPQDELDADGNEALEHRVAWEYWNGTEWATVPGMAEQLDSSPADLDSGGDQVETVLLTVPHDLEPTTVSDVEARWMRVRLVRGGYGFKKTVTWTDAGSDPEVTNSFTYIVSRPPALSAFRLGYAWTYGPFPPERVLTLNDFQYEDHTDEAIWPGKVFRPFEPPTDVTPALYLGFDKPLPSDRLGLYFDIDEQYGDSLGPAVRWEHWDGGAWRELPADDETRHLRLPGVVAVVSSAEGRSLARFGTPRWWLRARLAEDVPPGATTIGGIFLNAVWAVQQETVLDDPIGASTGLPSQVFALRRTPVLAGEQIDVRELVGPRADVEWRIVARELFPTHPTVIHELAELLGREGSATDITYGALRLRRDRNKHVTEVWVRWRGVDHFLHSGPNDRHYVIEGSRGRLRFGDGTRGKIPPAGSAIAARRYQVGGGSLGNVPAGSIAQLQGSIGGVDAVRNPVAAAGGADAETLDALRTRGPFAIRHRGRGLSATDLATIAKESSADVAMAHVLSARSADGRRHAGHVTIVVTPSGPDPRPWPSFGLRERVRRYVEHHADATVAGLGRIDVIGPSYVAIDVQARIVPVDPAEAGEIQRRVRSAVGRLLHPVHGGPEGAGWQPGRSVFLSDVASAVERVDGVDQIEDLSISIGDRIGGLRIDVGRDRTVSAGEIRLESVRES